MKQRSTEWCQRLSISAWLLLCISAAASAQSPCDPSKPIEINPWDRYHEREGDRCEGVYGVQPVSGDILGEIASFTLGKLQYQLDPRPLVVEWPSGVGGPVHLRAVALREDLLYQMDAVRSADTSSFEWPSDILVYRKIEPAELGVRAWVDATLLDQTRPLHVPVSVRQNGPAPDASRYWLVVVPGAALRKLEVAIDRLSAADAGASAPPAQKLQEVMPYESLQRTYYAAKRAVRFALPVLPEPGNYRLRLHAERDGDGESDIESFWFAHVVP
jgi:hypothetical protein